MPRTELYRARISRPFRDWMLDQAWRLHYRTAELVLVRASNWLIIETDAEAGGLLVFFTAISRDSFDVGNRGAAFRRYAVRKIAGELRAARVKAA